MPRKKATPPEPVVSGLAPIDAKPTEPLRDTAWRALAWAAHYGWIGTDFWFTDTTGRHFAFQPPGRKDMETLPVEGVCPFVAGLAMTHGEQKVRAVSGDQTLFDYLIGLGKEKS